MLKLQINICLIVILFLSIANIAYPKIKVKNEFEWNEITESDWEVVQDSSKYIFSAAMIFEKIEADDRKMNDNESRYTLYRRIRILNEIGRKYGDVEVPIMSISQRIKNIEGRTILPDGSIIKLEENHIFEKEAIKSKNSSFDQFTFSMPGVTTDCIIEYMIKYELDYKMYDHWIIQKDIPLLNGEYRWIFYSGEKGLDLAWTMITLGISAPNFLWLNCDYSKSVERLPSVKEATESLFKISDVPPFKEEPYTVPDVSRKAKLLCYYGPDSGPAAYWGEKAKNINDNANLFCKKNSKVKKIVESFNNLETDDEKIKAAYFWIQDNIINLKYDDVYDNKGTKINTKENFSVNDVLKHKYGEALDINRLYYDMLREMNINAKMAYALDRSENLFVYEAKYWQFDASLVAIPNGDNRYTYYIPSHKYLIPGTVPWYFEGSTAIVGGANSDLFVIPSTAQNFSSINRIYNLKINDSFEISGVIDSRFTGHNARRCRIYLEDNDSTEYEILLKERFEKTFENATLSSFQIENYDNINEPLTLSCNVDYPDLESVSNRVLLRPFVYFSESNNPFFDQKRENGIVFKHTYHNREIAQIELPEGWILDALPKDTTFSNSAGKCGVQFNFFGNKLDVQRYFELNSQFWRPDQYSIVKELFQTRRDFSDLIVILKQEQE